MAALPVLQQGRELPVCLCHDGLPDFYMADYSVMGLLVANLDRAYDVLESEDLTLHKKSDHLEVSVDRAEQISDIVDLLIKNGIDCGIADIVDQVYQG